jgi:hypothetical protein
MRVRVGQDEEHRPGTAKVQDREHARAHHREERHGFRGSVDRGAPILVEEQEDGGDERAGVADTDPPDQVHDGETPADRVVDAPDAQAFPEEVARC